MTKETNTVKEHNGQVDWVATNTSSTSNEQYVIKHSKFISTYDLADELTKTQNEVEFIPSCDPRLLTKLDENVIIVTD